MIKTLKKLLFNNHKPRDVVPALSPLNIVVSVVVFLSFYVVIPVYLTRKINPAHTALILFLFFLICIIAAVYLFNMHLSRLRALSLEGQDLEEKINKASYDALQSEKLKPQLIKKLGRYRELKSMVELINKELSLEYVVNTLVSIAFDVVSDKKGVACIYLVDPAAAKLKLFSVRKEHESTVIKAKEGDIFDHWVLKHVQSLFIEDINKDFRFDVEKLKIADARPVASLVAAPFTSEERILGILRLDSPQPNFFTQEDLAFLSTLCDLGAVALENASLYLKTKELAIHDSLTLLYTKGYFMERFREEFERAARQALKLSLLIMDIDYFKEYNDKYGHLAGDIILKNIGILLAEYFENKNAMLCRFGGEEFVILLPGTDAKQAKAWAEELRQKIEARKFMIRRKETAITASIGVASLSGQILDEQDLLRKADAALYTAKQKGRNRVCST
ncbi:MAG: sensor domain-containing diguanylate cyclase [Candidatus Omnitrophica bacterium]|nr:sensor domain-containing diguanylate cyclase [Candidatus Omnitrophota bacterium]MDD5610792.1 sensor domain-containing diguanylate cyclase [Candidatus Omnitrophota bacterium]